jgi:hypothetical protein
MSNEENRRDETLAPDTPRLEPWLIVMLLAIVPMLVALAVPNDLVMHLAAISGILFAVGAALLLVQERRRR